MSEEPTVETLLQGTRSRTKIASDALAIEMELKILYGEGKKSAMPFKMKSLIFKYVFVFVSTSFMWWGKVGLLGQTNFENISYSTSTLPH